MSARQQQAAPLGVPWREALRITLHFLVSSGLGCVICCGPVI
jgi:hypothetical protein